MANKLNVVIGANISEFAKAMKDVAKELRTLERQFSGFEQVGRRLSNIGRTLTLGVTVPLAAAGAAATKLAMDAVESENLFEVSMGKMAQAARNWSKELSDTLGLNEYEIRRNVGTMNVMLTSMGMAEGAAFDMAKSLTQLSYDMASFYNLKPEEAFEKLQSAISGEVEPLKRLGIVVNETTVKTFAYTHSIAEQGTELTEQQKILARYGAIMEATSKAQGDLGRTLESPANQLRILKSQLQEAGIAFGQALIPVVKTATEVLNGFVKWLNDLDPSVKNIVVGFAALTAAIGPALLLTGKLLSAIPNMVSGYALLKKGLASASTAFAAWQTGATSAAGALQLLAGAFTPFLVGGAIIAGLAAIAAMFVEMREKARLAKVEIASISDLAEAERVRAYWEEQVRALEGRQKAYDEVAKALEAGDPTAPYLARAIGTGVQPPDVAKLEEARQKLEEAIARVKELKEASEEASKTGLEEYFEKFKAWLESLSGSGGAAAESVRTVTDVLNDLRNGLDRAARMEEAFGDQFNLNEEKARLFREAIEDLIALGLDPQDERLKSLIEKYQQLGNEMAAMTRQGIIAEMNQQLAQAAEKEQLLGDAFNLNAEKARIFAATIDRLITAGATADDPLLQTLKQKLDIVSQPIPVNEIQQIQAQASEQMAELVAQSAIMSFGDFMERAAALIQDTVAQLLAKHADPAVVERYIRGLMQIGTRSVAVEPVSEWQELQQLLADQRALAVERRTIEEQIAREQARQLQQYGADQRAIAAEGLELAQQQANLKAYEEERLFKQLIVDARAFEAESRAIAEEIGNLAAAEEERLFKQMIADARAFEAESKALAEQEANLKAYEQEQLMRAAIQGARAIEAEGREYEAWKAREQARQIQQYGADQRAIQAEGRAYEEWRARMIEKTLREWEQGVLRIEGLQTQAVRRMLEEDNRAYEQWRARLQEQILMAQVSVGRSLTNRLDVETQIAIRLGEPAETLQAEASAIEAAIDKIVVAMLALGAGTDEILANIDPLLKRWKEVNDEIQAMRAGADMIVSLQHGLSEGLQSAGNAWGDFMAMVVDSIEVAVDSVRGITIDLQQSLYNLASQGLNLLGQAVVDLFTLPERMRREYRYGAYGQVNYPDLAQMVENYQNWDENYQALLHAQQAQAGMTVGGGLLGGLLGFLIGGPIGAFIGAGLGAGAGYLAGQAAYGGAIEDLKEKLQDTFQKIAEALQTAIGNVADALGNAFSADTYQGFLSEFARDLESVVKGGLIRAFMAGEVMRPLLQSLSDFITQAVWDGVLSAEEQLGLQEQFQEIIAVAGPFWEALSQFDFAGALGIATEAVNDFAEALRNVPTGFKVETYRWNAAAPVPMAAGGIVTRPTLALVGEAGREAVVPLDDRDLGYGELHLHIHGDVYGYDDLEHKVEMMMNRISRRTGLRRYGLELGGVHG